MNAIKGFASRPQRSSGTSNTRKHLAAGVAATVALAVSAGCMAAAPYTSSENGLYRFNPTTAVVVWSGLRGRITSLSQISAQLGQPLSESNYDRLGRPTQFSFQFPLEGAADGSSPASATTAGRVAHMVMRDVKTRLIHRGISAIFARFGGAVGGIASNAAAHMESGEAMASLPTSPGQQGQPPFTAQRYPGYHWLCVFTFDYRHNAPVWNGVQPMCSPMP